MSVHSKSVAESAANRRSVRVYSGEKVPQSDLKDILRIASSAPSAFNFQPWRVVVVEDEALKQQLMGAAYGQKQVGAASAVFVIYSDMKDALENAIEFVHPGMGDRRAEAAEGIKAQFSAMSDDALAEWGVGQSYIFVGYLLLAIESLGYASSPMLGFEPDKVIELLGLPKGVRLPALISVGVGAEEGFSQHRHPLERFVTWR